MIAPLKQSALENRQGAHWAGARRAVAALLLKPTTKSVGAPPVSRRATWLFIAWATAVAVLYLMHSAWGRLEQ